MTEEFYPPEKTALLIIDPYNDFMTEGGKLFDMIKESAISVNCFDHMRQIIAAARKAKIQIFIVPHHRAKPDDYTNWSQTNGPQMHAKDLQTFAAGTWGGDWNSDFGPKDGDVIIHEHWAQSGFANTDLDQQLKQHGKSKIILIGFVANTCIESTGRFGMELGYHVTLVNDATAAFSAAGMKAAEENAPTFAHAIFSAAELLEHLIS